MIFRMNESLMACIRVEKQSDRWHIVTKHSSDLPTIMTLFQLVWENEQMSDCTCPSLYNLTIRKYCIKLCSPWFEIYDLLCKV